MYRYLLAAMVALLLSAAFVVVTTNAAEDYIRIYYEVYETFDDGVFDVGSPMTGINAMTIEDGKLVLVPFNTSGTYGYGLWTPLYLGNATISFDFYPCNVGVLDLMIIVLNNNGFDIAFNVTGGQISIVVLTARGTTTVASANYSFVEGSLYHVSIKIINETVDVYINGSKVIDSANISDVGSDYTAMAMMTYNAESTTTSASYMDNLYIASVNYMPVEYVTTTTTQFVPQYITETETVTETTTTTMFAIPITNELTLMAAVFIMVIALAIVLRRR